MTNLSGIAFDETCKGTKVHYRLAPWSLPCRGFLCSIYTRSLHSIFHSMGIVILVELRKDDDFGILAYTLMTFKTKFLHCDLFIFLFEFKWQYILLIRVLQKNDNMKKKYIKKYTMMDSIWFLLISWIEWSSQQR